MIIEPLSYNDLPDAVDVIAESFEKLVAPTWSDNAIQLFLESDLSIEKLGGFIASGFICLKAVENGRMLGVLVFSSNRKLAHLFVRPKAFRAGVASKLFTHARGKVAERSDVEYIELTSTECAVVVYEKLGFRKSAQAFRYNGCIFQPMEYWVKKIPLIPGRCRFAT